MSSELHLNDHLLRNMILRAGLLAIVMRLGDSLHKIGQPLVRSEIAVFPLFGVLCIK